MSGAHKLAVLALALFLVPRAPCPRLGMRTADCNTLQCRASPSANSSDPHARLRFHWATNPRTGRRPSEEFAHNHDRVWYPATWFHRGVEQGPREVTGWRPKRRQQLATSELKSERATNHRTGKKCVKSVVVVAVVVAVVVETYLYTIVHTCLRVYTYVYDLYIHI